MRTIYFFVCTQLALVILLVLPLCGYYQKRIAFLGSESIIQNKDDIIQEGDLENEDKLKFEDNM